MVGEGLPSRTAKGIKSTNASLTVKHTLVSSYSRHRWHYQGQMCYLQRFQFIAEVKVVT